MDMENILQEQIAYYRARATEYDEWFYRQGRYDKGAEANQQWFDEAEVVQKALHSLPHQGHILELAAGTGIWTKELVKLADKVTVIDAAPEMLDITKEKVQSNKVDYIVADLFQWQPQQQYDMVFFGFWLSHVPPQKLDAFLKTVAAALKPDGRVFMVDSRRNSTGMANDQPHLEDGISQERLLNDGNRYTIIKIYYETSALEAAFKQAGLEANAHYTDTYFIYAQGQKV
jgi:ubiquinone/menaquinone biosynthesis C-methylase UbiE